MTTFDSDKYKVPTGNVAALLALGRSLIAAYRKDAPPLVKKMKKRLDEAVANLEDSWSKLDASSGGLDARLADNVIDNAHAAIAATLEMFSWLPKHRAEKDVEDARHVRERLYGGGLEFLKAPFPEEWAESEKRIRRIHEENLQPTLERLCGKELVQALFTAHTEYGVALGITKAEDPVVATKVGEPFQVLPNVIQQYIRTVIGMVDDEDEDTVEMATAMLRPVEVFRTRVLNARGGKGSSDPVKLGDVETDPAAPTQPVAPAQPAHPAQPAPTAPASPEVNPGK